MENKKQLIDAWYCYAACTDGFIGAALRAQRNKASMTQEQQRSLLGIIDESNDHLWLHLQGMLLPRPGQFMADLVRIVEKVVQNEGTGAVIDIGCLGNLIHSGLS